MTRYPPPLDYHLHIEYDSTDFSLELMYLYQL